MTGSSACEMGKDKIRHLIFMEGRWRYKPSAAMNPHGFKFMTLSAGVIIGGHAALPLAEERMRP